jgi:hypothetical protein
MIARARCLPSRGFFRNFEHEMKTDLLNHAPFIGEPAGNLVKLDPEWFES